MRLLLGILIGVFISISAFEFVHKSVEVEGGALCGMIVDGLGKDYRPGLVYQVKVIYKLFAWPMKTVYIYFTDDKDPKMVVQDGDRFKVNEFP